MTEQHADLLSEHVQIESFLQSPLTGFVLQQDSGLFWDFDRDRPGVFTSSCLLPDQQIAEAWRIQLIEESLGVFGLLSLDAMNRAYVLSETYTVVIEQLYTIPKPYRTRYQAVQLLLCSHTQLSAG
ncbi:hypothetical protein [Paenibacillus bovis]|nr:hypothetical protein [Paenibacillus bovis]